MNEPIAALPIETLLEHREWVRRVARVLVADESVADDLEQDLWVKSIERPPHVRGSIRGWLAAALRNALQNRRRSEARRARREAAASRPEREPPAGDVVALAEAHRVVVAAILDLQEPYRRMVLLRFFEGLAPAEIATLEGIPVETVRTRLKRALATLRERFDAKADGDRGAWMSALLPLAVAEPAIAVGSGGASVAGGFLMQTSTKIAVAVVLAAAAGLTGYLAWQELTPSAPPSPSEEAGARAPEGMPAARAGGPTLAAGQQTSSVAVTHRRTEVASPPDTRPAMGTGTRAAMGTGTGATTEPGTSPPAVRPGKPGPAGEISGRLLWMADRTPLAGASVSILSNDLPAGGKLPENRGATTGSDGLFRLSSLPPATWWLVASKEGFAPQPFSAKVLDGSGEGEIEISLAAAGWIEGRVTDGRGDPAAGLTVRCESQGGAAVELSAVPTVTDAEGAYRIARAAGGYVVVLERARGQAQRAGVSVVEGKTTRLDFAGGANLKGKVSDESRAPMAGVRVRALEAAGAYASREATTDETGRFQIEEVQPGEWRLHIQVFGPRGFTAEVASVHVFPGENDVDVDLSRTDLAGEVLGRVLSGGTGTPFKEGQVQLSLLVLESKGGAWTLGRSFHMAFADAEGRFRFRAVPAGRYRFAAAPLSGALRLHDEDFDLFAGERKDLHDVTLEAMKVGNVKFVVKDEAGAPVAHAAFATRKGSDMWTFDPGNPEPGTYTTQLEVGKANVHVSRAGLAAVDVKVEVREGETANVDVVLRPEAGPR